MGYISDILKYAEDKRIKWFPRSQSAIDKKIDLSRTNIMKFIYQTDHKLDTDKSKKKVVKKAKKNAP